MNEGVPQNYSQIRPEGELSPSRDAKSGFSRYVDHRDVAHYRISEFGRDSEAQARQKQMVVQQLASFVEPVAPIHGTRVDGMRDYFSVDVREHPEYSKEKKDMPIVDTVLLSILFDDMDHDEISNFEGGVFYDFGVASLQGVKGSQKMYWEEYLTGMEKKQPGSMAELKQKILYFKKQISGEEGLRFIQSVCAHAGYTEIGPETIQTNLLERCTGILEQIQWL